MDVIIFVLSVLVLICFFIFKAKHYEMHENPYLDHKRDSYLIDCKCPDNIRAFVEMFEDGSCGYHWCYIEKGLSCAGPEGVFDGVRVPHHLQKEIKKRDLSDPMSPDLKEFSDKLWELFCKESSNNMVFKPNA